MRGRKILVVDDERHIVRLIQVNLERQGATVITAFDGREGLEKALSERPELMVTDTNMPVLDGLELLKAVRRPGSGIEEIPVIILSCRSKDTDVFEAYHYGASMYLTKPFNPMEVVTVVRRHLPLVGIS